MGPLHYHDISTLPRIHTIVWCRLPDLKGNPGNSVRPALVRGTKRHPGKGRGGVLVSYGTTKLDSTKFGQLDLIIQNNGRMADLGLPQAVRFDLGKANWLPWSVEFFHAPEHSFYVVAGALNASELKRLRVRLKRRGIITEL